MCSHSLNVVHYTISSSVCFEDVNLNFYSKFLNPVLISLISSPTSSDQGLYH